MAEDRDSDAIVVFAVYKAHCLGTLDVAKNSFRHLEICVHWIRIELRELLDCIYGVSVSAENCVYKAVDHCLILLDVRLMSVLPLSERASARIAEIRLSEHDSRSGDRIPLQIALIPLSKLPF
jgi:hypothetical protein